jgi:hypothetical protein
MIRSRIRPTWPTLPISFAVAFAVSAFASQARAEDQAAIEKIVQMNKKALDDYDTLEWDSAKKTLLDALMLGKKAGLDNHPVMARTYVHLGAVYITGLKNRDKAIQSFTRALEIDPAIQLSKGIATSDVADAFAEAKRARGGGGGGGGDTTPPPSKKRRGPVMEGDNSGEAPPPRRKAAPKSSTSDDDSEEKDLPIKIQALDCPNEDEAIIDKPATLRCAVAPNLPVAKVFLMYREPGKEDYTEIPMTRSPKGWWVGKVPKKAVTGTSVAYYFEGRDASGKPVVRNGEKDGPNFLLPMEEDAYKELKSKKREDLGEDVENPLEKQAGPVKGNIYGRKRKDVGLDVRYGNRKWWIGLGGGSGFGYAKGDGLEAVNRSPDQEFHSLKTIFAPGGAWAGLGHLAPELGFQLTPNFALSLEGRFQLLPPQQGQFSKYAATGAAAGFLKGMIYTKQSQIRFFGTGIVGAGEFRLVVKPVASLNLTCSGSNPDRLCNVQNFQDTVRGGPAIVGGGGGVYYEAGHRTSIVFEVHGLAGVPVFSFVVDAQLALQINFYSEGKPAVDSEGRYVPKEEDEEPK